VNAPEEPQKHFTREQWLAVKRLFELIAESTSTKQDPASNELPPRPSRSDT
jgi:hypothetical protein